MVVAMAGGQMLPAANALFCITPIVRDMDMLMVVIEGLMRVLFRANSASPLKPQQLSHKKDESSAGHEQEREFHLFPFPTFLRCPLAHF